jgi:hypothetical protein
VHTVAIFFEADTVNQDIFVFVAPVYTLQKDSGPDNNAMLVSALSILSYVVLSPELGNDNETEMMMHQRSSQAEAPKKTGVTEQEELLSISRDASDSCLWSMLDVFHSLLDVVALRNPSKRPSALAPAASSNEVTSSHWHLLKNRCFEAIKRFGFLLL